VKPGTDAEVTNPIVPQPPSLTPADPIMNEKSQGSKVSDNQIVSPKRFSDDGREPRVTMLRKKSGFSGFVSGLVGSPKKPIISAPENPVHVTHVGYDSATGQFTVGVPPPSPPPHHPDSILYI
jgi:p21-activated kinase 1